MFFLSALLVGLTPWIAGGLLGLLLSRKYCPAVRLLVALSFALLAQEALAILGLVLASFGINIFSTTTVVLLLVAIAVLGWLNRPQRLKATIAVRFAPAVFLCLFSCLFIFLSFVAFTLPASGWDTLWHWAPISVELLQTQTQEPPISWHYSGTHPATVAAISAWWAAWYPGGEWTIGFGAWILCWISASVAVGSYVYATCRNLTISLFAAYIVASMPLLENHALQGGYAEIFIVCHVVISAALLNIGAKKRDKFLLALGLLVATGTIALKNIGWLYGLAVIVGLIISHYRLFTPLVQTLALAVIAFIFIGISQHDENIQFFFGNRTLSLEMTNTGQIFTNQIYALFVNSSFSIAPLLFFTALGLSWTASGGQQNYSELPLVAAAFTLGFLTLSQFTDYGFLYALPQSDTGNSRLSIPFAAMSIMTIPYIVERIQMRRATAP